jgi:hypothetical protein
VELGVAYTHQKLQRLNKFLIGLHTDAHSAFMGSKLNPMICVPLEYVAPTEKQLLQVLSGSNKIKIVSLKPESSPEGSFRQTYFMFNLVNLLRALSKFPDHG